MVSGIHRVVVQKDVEAIVRRGMRDRTLRTEFLVDLVVVLHEVVGVVIDVGKNVVPRT